MRIVHDDAVTGRRFAASVHAAIATPSEAFSAFCALADGPCPPHFSETSVSLPASGRPQCERLTHYFDVRTEPARAAAWDYLARAAAATGIASPVGLGEHLARRPDTDALAQLVVGIDGGSDTRPLRLKLYVALSAPAPALVDALLEVSGRPRPSGVDPAAPFLVGLDLGPSGPTDAKVYLRLPRAQLPRAVRREGPYHGWLATSDEVVLAVSLADPARRVLHLHTGHVAAQLRALHAATVTVPGLADALDHARRAEGGLGGARLLPYVVGLPWHDGVLSAPPMNVYFHPTTDPRALAEL